MRAGVPPLAERLRGFHRFALAVPLRDSVTAFIATTRGLEEAGTAPQNAVNRYEVLAPILARQSELGLHWRISDSVTAVATAFDIEKPEPGFDAHDVYRYLTTVRHRGMDASVSSRVSENLTLVFGGLWMRPELEGESVDAGLAAGRPLGAARVVQFRATPAMAAATVHRRRCDVQQPQKRHHG